MKEEVTSRVPHSVQPKMLICHDWHAQTGNFNQVYDPCPACVPTVYTLVVRSTRDQHNPRLLAKCGDRVQVMHAPL